MIDFNYLILSGSSFFLIVLGICVKYKFSHCKLGTCCSIDNNNDINKDTNDTILIDLPGIAGNNLNKV